MVGSFQSLGSNWEAMFGEAANTSIQGWINENASDKIDFKEIKDYVVEQLNEAIKQKTTELEILTPEE